ncbi:MAG TPA: hypothetical protein VEZ24_09320 [Microvirga sp.]|nr:hypothetical protein [Microvirga sp.]
MAVERDAMIVSVEARINNIERQMAKASATSRKHFTRIESDAKTMASRVNATMGKVGEGLKTAFVGFAGGLVGGLAAGGVLGVLGSVQGAMSELANVAAEAKRAGLGGEAFQELSYAAMQSRVSIDALTDGLKEMQLRADEFIVTGKGSGEEAFKRLGYSATELNEKLKDPPKLFEEIIDKLGQLDKSSQIRIADEIFGGEGGEQFVRFLDKGAGAIARARQEARDTGNVLSEDMLKKAVEIDQQFETIARTIGTNVKGAIVSVVSALKEFVGEASMLNSRSIEAVSDRISKIKTEMESLQKIEADARRMFPNALESAFAGNADKLKAYRDELGKLEEHLGRLKTSAPTSPGEAPPTTPAGGKGDLSQIDVAGSKKKALEGYAALEQAALARINTLRVEQQALGLTTGEAEKLRFEQQLLAEATRDGTILTQTQKDRISELAGQYGALTAAIEQTEKAQQEANQAAEYFGDVAVDAISDLALEGRNLDDVLQNIAKSLAQAAIQAAILGQGPLAGLLGTSGVNGAPGGIIGALLKSFSPVKAATGGYIRGRGTGTSDSIPARLSNGEYVVNARATAANRKLLDAINYGRVPRFAEGGFVGVPTVPTPIARGSGGGMKTEVHIHEAQGVKTTVKETRGPSGVRFDVYARQLVEGMVADGSLDRVAKGRWGVNPMRGR